MHYRWIGRKPLHRASNAAKVKGRSIGQVPEVLLTDVVQGTIFTPTESERISFRDLMEPVVGPLMVGTGGNEDDDQALVRD